MPLQGLTIVDLSHYLAGSLATVVLADLGARVVKVESSARPDGIRRRVPRHGGTMRRPVSYQLLRDKEVLDLDLKSPEGRARLAELVRGSSVVVENFSAGTLDRLGVGWSWLRAVDPAVSLVSIRAFTTGSALDAIKAGAPSIQAMTGVDALLGTQDGQPLALGRPVGDMIAGVNAALAVLTCHRASRERGEGCHVTVGIDRSLRELFFPEMATAAASASPHGFYRCRGADEWLAVTCAGDAEWRALARAVAGTDLAADPRFADPFRRALNAGALDDVLAESFGRLSLDEAVDRLTGRGVSFMPLLSPERQLREEIFTAHHAIRYRRDDDVGAYPTVRHVFGEPWPRT